MENITLTTEAVNAYKELMTNPKNNGLDFPPLEECFDVYESGTAKHILYQEYIDKIKKPLPKVFFYIIMDDIYFDRIVKCLDGNLGYKLKIKI